FDPRKFHAPPDRRETDLSRSRQSGHHQGKLEGKWIEENNASRRRSYRVGLSCNGRHLVPNSTAIRSAGGLLVSSAPLFEEERGANLGAHVVSFTDPCGIERARLRPAFAADDRPMNAGKAAARH